MLRVEDLPATLPLERRERGLRQVDYFCSLLTFIEQNLKIVPKAATKPILLQLNEVQIVLAHVIAWTWALCAPCYLIVPKARQMGVTTFFTALFFARCVTLSNFRSMIVGNVEKTSREVFKMARVFERELPPRARFKLLSKSKGMIEWESGSCMQIGMVGEGGGDALGKGFTVNGFHGTETANWGDRVNPDEAWASISPALVKQDETLGELVCAFESTGKGQDRFFKATWDEAQKRRFVRVFLPWYLDARYSLSREDYAAELLRDDPDAAPDYRLTREEKLLRLEIAGLVPGPGEQYCVWPHALTLEQLLWRRVALSTECFGRVDLFDRYYPSTWDRAFRVAGDSPFGEEVVAQLRSRVQAPTGMGYMAGNRFMLFEGANPNKWACKFWKAPKKGSTYVVVADPADGTDEGDPSACYVIRYRKGVRQFEVVAAIWGTIDEDTLASQAVQIATAYNRAWLVIEKNRPGCVKAARAMGYSRLYWQKNPQDPANPKGRGKHPGFFLGKANRAAIFALLKQVCRDDQFFVYDAGLADEVEQLEKKGDKWQAKEGATDDRVIAAGIGVYVAAELSGFFRNRRSSSSADDRDTGVTSELYEEMVRRRDFFNRGGKRPPKFLSLG